MVTSIGSAGPPHGKPATTETEKHSVKKGHGESGAPARTAGESVRPGRKLDELSSGIKINRREHSGTAVQINHSRLAASAGAAGGHQNSGATKTLIRAMDHAVDLQTSLLTGDSGQPGNADEPGAELFRLTEVIRILSDAVRGSDEQAVSGHARILETIDSDVIAPFFHLAERSTEVLARPTSDTIAESGVESGSESVVDASGGEVPGEDPGEDPRPALLASLGELKADLRGLNEEIIREAGATGASNAGGHILFTDHAAKANAEATRDLIAGRAAMAIAAHDPIPAEEALLLLQD